MRRTEFRALGGGRVYNGAILDRRNENPGWYSESSVRPNTLVRFDTERESFQTWVIPLGGGVIRNMMATADGNLVLACSAVNRVALVEVGN